MSDLTLADAARLVFLASFATLLVLVTLYAWALRKRPHQALWMLLAANCLYVAYYVLTGISSFIELSERLATNLYRIGTFLAFPALALVLAGSVSLVRAYLSAGTVPADQSGRSLVFKAVMAKLGNGLLIGVGFALAMTAVTYGFSKWQMNEMAEEMFKDYTPEAGLEVVEHRPQKPTNNDAFIGSIRNNGKDTWEGVEILAEMFGKSGEFVDKCSSYIDGSIAPGQTRNFKVSCAGCRDVRVPLAYDKYTIAISDARYVRAKKMGSN